MGDSGWNSDDQNTNSNLESKDCVCEVLNGKKWMPFFFSKWKLIKSIKCNNFPLNTKKSYYAHSNWHLSIHISEEENFLRPYRL